MKKEKDKSITRGKPLLLGASVHVTRIARYYTRTAVQLCRKLRMVWGAVDPIRGEKSQLSRHAQKSARVGEKRNELNY